MPVVFRRRDRWLNRILSGGVKDDIEKVARKSVMGEKLVSAEAGCDRGFAGLRGGDDIRAAIFAELHRDMTNAARAAKDQELLPGAQRGAIKAFLRGDGNQIGRAHV